MKKILSCLLLLFSAFSSYSSDNLVENSDENLIDRCEIKFIKPKEMIFLSPEHIRSLASPLNLSLSRERRHTKIMTLYSIRPKHLFFKGQGERNRGDLKWKIEQFQALDLNFLHPNTLEYILSRPDSSRLVSIEQVQKLDFRNISFRAVILLIMKFSPIAELEQKFQAMDLSRWPEEGLTILSQSPLFAQYMSEEQISFIKERKVPSSEELTEQKKAKSLAAMQRKKEIMEAVKDHGVFAQAIADDTFDRDLIPFLRISELNDQSVSKVLYMIYEISEKEIFDKERQKILSDQLISQMAVKPDTREKRRQEISNHIFNTLSNENTLALFQRSPKGLESDYWSAIIPHLRDHSVFNEAVDSLFGSAETDEELHQNMNSEVLVQLRFPELNDQVIEKIRRAAFHHPGSLSTRQISKENIAELIKRKGGLDAVATPYKKEDTTVLTILFQEDRLTAEIIAYALYERPDLLSQKMIDRIPTDILKDLEIDNVSQVPIDPYP